MGRGEKARKRVLNQLKAKFEKKNRLPALNSQIKKKESKIKADDLPASLRKMMAMKAAAEGGNSRPNRNKFARAPPRQNLKEKPTKGAKNEAIPSTSERVDSAAHEEQQPAVTGPKQQKPQPRQTMAQQQQQSMVKQQAQGKALKQRKKEFLNKKKLKKKGKFVSEEDDVSDKEADFKVAALASKPAFGEQAHQPIQVNLKRKHWQNKERTAAERCKDVFVKQMNDATRHEAGLTDGHGALQARSSKKKGVSVEERARLDVIEAYRQNKRRPAGEDGEEGNDPIATIRSLAALVRKNAGGN